MVGALSRKVLSMHMDATSTFQLFLRQLIANNIVEDELYVQIKDKLQQWNLEQNYEGYHLEGDKLPIYKSKNYISNAANLRRIVWMKSIKCHILIT